VGFDCEFNGQLKAVGTGLFTYPPEFHCCVHAAGDKEVEAASTEGQRADVLCVADALGGAFVADVACSRVPCYFP